MSSSWRTTPSSARPSPTASSPRGTTSSGRGTGRGRWPRTPSTVPALLGLAAIDPDAWIARHNVERLEESGKVDWGYLQGLSDDAVPVLAQLPDDQASCALAGWSDQDDDWLAWNLGRARAADAVAEHPEGVRIPAHRWAHDAPCPGAR